MRILCSIGTFYSQLILTLSNILLRHSIITQQEQPEPGCSAGAGADLNNTEGASVAGQYSVVFLTCHQCNLFLWYLIEVS